MSTRMQQRRGTAAQWISTNSGNGPILAAGEIGFESDTNKFKIGDGVNHWVDLTYFTDAESAIAAIEDLIAGAPAALDTLNELAAALGDDADFATNITTMIGDVEQVIADHAILTTNVHGITDMAALATTSYVDTALSNSTVDQSTLAGEGISWNGDTEQFDIDATVATVAHVDQEIGSHNSDTTSVHGIANTADLATASSVDSAISTHNSDTTSVHGISDTAALATKSFVTNLLVSATKTDIAITGDENGLTITAENGVADSDTDDLAEGTNHLYFTDERAQDAVGNLVGTGLTYTDATGEIAVDTAVIQERVANVSDTEIGYLNGVTSSVQTQLDAKSTDLSNHSSDTTNIHGIADTAALALTADVDSALDLKASLSGATFTGTVTLHADPASALHAATKQYVDNTASGIVAKPQVLGATTANIDATYNNGTAGVGATLTHNSNGVFPAQAGGAEGWAVGKGILVKNQTNKAQNGRYYISDMGSPSTPYVLTRCGYCDEASEIPGAYIFVQDGTNAGTGWVQTVADATTFTVGTDDITVVQFSGSGTITAGTNISVNGNEVSTVTNPSFDSATIGNVSDTEIQYLNGVTSAIQTQLDSKAAALATANSQTASYTIVLSDKDKVVEMNIGSANTITVSPDSTSDFPIGTQIDILQVGSGQTTVVAGSGVTINATPGLKLRTQWAGATLRKRAANTWVLVGDLTA